MDFTQFVTGELQSDSVNTVSLFDIMRDLNLPQEDTVLFKSVVLFDDKLLEKLSMSREVLEEADLPEKIIKTIIQKEIESKLDIKTIFKDLMNSETFTNKEISVVLEKVLSSPENKSLVQNIFFETFNNQLAYRVVEKNDTNTVSNQYTNEISNLFTDELSQNWFNDIILNNTNLQNVINSEMVQRISQDAINQNVKNVLYNLSNVLESKLKQVNENSSYFDLVNDKSVYNQTNSNNLLFLMSPDVYNSEIINNIGNSIINQSGDVFSEHLTNNISLVEKTRGISETIQKTDIIDSVTNLFRNKYNNYKNVQNQNNVTETKNVLYNEQYISNLSSPQYKNEVQLIEEHYHNTVNNVENKFETFKTEIMEMVEQKQAEERKQTTVKSEGSKNYNSPNVIDNIPNGADNTNVIEVPNPERIIRPLPVYKMIGEE